MLYLVGLGFEETDLTVKGIEIAKKCDCFCELYTNDWKGDLSKLEATIGKKIEIFLPLNFGLI